MFLLEMLLAALTAVLAENIFFARALDSGKMYDIIKSPRNLVVFGGMVTAMTTLSTILCFIMHVLVKNWNYQSIVKPTIYLVCMSIVYIGATLFFSKYKTEWYKSLGMSLRYATFNCAVLGALLVSTKQAFGFFQALGYGLGTGIGFIAAMYMVQLGKNRLEFCKVPKSFAGLPILLVYIGIISLAIYGLIGHQLPT